MKLIFLLSFKISLEMHYWTNLNLAIGHILYLDLICNNRAKNRVCYEMNIYENNADHTICKKDTFQFTVM